MTSVPWPLLALFLVGAGLLASDHPQATTVVAVGIALYASASFVGFGVHVRRLRADMAGFQAAVEALPADGSGRAAMSVPESLAPLWHGYVAEMLRDPITGAPRGGGPAAAHFNQASVVERRMNLAFYQAVPGLLVGVGICFTFLGLAMALQFASQGAAAGDAALTRASLRSLYGAASFKFVTSIVALACSVLYAAAEKRTMHALLADLDALCLRLDRRFPPLRAEEALVHLVERSLLQAAPAPAPAPAPVANAMPVFPAPEEFGRHVGQAVARAIDESLTPHLKALGTPGDDPAMGRAVDAWSAHLDRARADADAQLGGVREAFQANMVTFLAAQNQALAGTLDDQREGLSRVVADLERVVRREAELRAAGQAEHERALASMREAMAEIHAFAGNVGLYSGERIQQLQQLAEANGDQVKNVESGYAGIVSTLDEAMARSNVQLKTYLEVAEERQTHFFDTYDGAVTKLYEKLLQAANYLVSAEQQRRDGVK